MRRATDARARPAYGCSLVVTIAEQNRCIRVEGSVRAPTSGSRVLLAPTGLGTKQQDPWYGQRELAPTGSSVATIRCLCPSRCPPTRARGKNDAILGPPVPETAPLEPSGLGCARAAPLTTPACRSDPVRGWQAGLAPDLLKV